MSFLVVLICVDSFFLLSYSIHLKSFLYNLLWGKSSGNELLSFFIFWKRKYFSLLFSFICFAEYEILDCFFLLVLKRCQSGEFPGTQVGRICSFHCQGLGLILVGELDPGCMVQQKRCDSIVNSLILCILNVLFFFFSSF